LKAELKKARSKADQTSITEACLKEKEAENVHLKATNSSLSIDLNKAKVNCNFVFEDKQKAEIKALMACDKEKEPEIVQLKATNGSLSIDLDKAKATAKAMESLETELEKVKCSVTKILNSDLQKKVIRMKEQKEQKAENEALKAELKKARSKADQTSITEACLKEKEAEIIQLKATNSGLSIDLNKAKANCNFVFEDEQKAEIKALMACDKEKEAEIVQLKATNGSLSIDLDKAKATAKAMETLETELEKVKCSVTKILNSDLQKKVNRMKEQQEQKAENEALKAELKKARSKADQTSITEAYLKEKEAEIVPLKATNSGLSIDLNKAKANCNFVFEDKQKAEIRALIACDKEKEAEIVQLKATNGSLSIDLDKAKATCNFVFEDEQKECKCFADLQKIVNRMKELMDLREKEIRLLNDELKNSE
jgi:hypothetical protein